MSEIRVLLLGLWLLVFQAGMLVWAGQHHMGLSHGWVVFAYVGFGASLVAALVLTVSAKIKGKL